MYKHAQISCLVCLHVSDITGCNYDNECDDDGDDDEEEEDGDDGDVDHFSNRTQ